MGEFAGPTKANATTTASATPQQQQQGSPEQQRFPSSYTQGAPQPGRFLKPEERSTLISLIVGRVGNAQLNYNIALTDLKVEKLIEKKEDLSLWTKLLIIGASFVLEKSIMHALSELKTAGEAVKELKKAAIKIEKKEEGEAQEKILGLSESSVEMVVGLGVDKAKENQTERSTEMQGEAQEEEKVAATNYIQYLRDASSIAFQHVREDRMGTGTDEQLLALFAAFDPKRHLSSTYYGRLKQQIDTYMNSHAKDIGHKVEDKKVDGDKGTTHIQVRKETRVAWLVNGRKGRQLVYVAKEFKADEPTFSDPGKGIAKSNVGGDTQPGEAYEAEENALGLEEEGTWNSSGKESKGRKAEVESEFLGPVEPELVDVALATHEKRWLQEPQTIIMGPYGVQVAKWTYDGGKRTK